MDTAITETVLNDLHRLVAAEPKGPDGKPLPLCAEVLARIQEVRGATWLELSREQRKAFTDLRGEYESAAGNAAEMARLDLRLMGALSASARVVKDLSAKGAAAQLAAAAIVADEQIWSRTKSNRNGELKKLADALGVAMPDFLDALTASCMATANENGPGWWRRHWMDTLIVFLVAAVLSMALVAGTKVGGIPATSAMQLVATRDIAPFEPITRDNAARAKTPRQTGAFADVAGAAGRYPAARITKDTVLTAPELSAGRLSGRLEGRSVLRISMKPATPSLPWILPANVSLVLAPRHAGMAPLLVHGVDLLAVQPGADGGVVWVAVDSGELPEIAARLGDADVLFAKP